MLPVTAGTDRCVAPFAARALSSMATDDEYERWVLTVPAEITTDTIWRTPAYRFSLFAMSCAHVDAQLIAANRPTRALVDQLLRAVGSISANLEEGYSRSSGRERAHFYEYALGSTRESRGWYYRCATALPAEVVPVRLATMTRIIRILTVVIPRERDLPLLKPVRRSVDGRGPIDRQDARSTSKQ